MLEEESFTLDVGNYDRSYLPTSRVRDSSQNLVSELHSTSGSNANNSPQSLKKEFWLKNLPRESEPRVWCHASCPARNVELYDWHMSHFESLLYGLRPVADQMLLSVKLVALRLRQYFCQYLVWNSNQQFKMRLGEGNFCYKEGVLYCEDIELSRLEDNLLVENLTPCYVYSKYFFL